MSATKPPAPPSTRRQPRWGAWDLDTIESIEATTALPEPTTMPPAELDRQCKVYAARFISGEPFSPEERAHWADCEEAHQEYVEARTWTITRRQ